MELFEKKIIITLIITTLITPRPSNIKSHKIQLGIVSENVSHSSKLDKKKYKFKIKAQSVPIWNNWTTSN